MKNSLQNTSSIPKKFEVFHHKMADPVHTPGDVNKNHPMASITDHHMTGKLCQTNQGSELESCDILPAMRDRRMADRGIRWFLGGKTVN